MLKKLLKYDFISVFKYWWIAALASFVLSLGGGWCISILTSDKDFPAAIYILTSLLLVLVVISYIVFTLLSLILIFTRFYKNFFTDEGYLTFTLPVKRSQLLNSKLILSTGTMLATDLLLIVNIIVMLWIGLAGDISFKLFLVDFADAISLMAQKLGWYLAIYILEALALLVLANIFSSLFLFCCITFASIITKKAKVITAIGIYYGAESVFSFALQIFYLFGAASLSFWISALPAGSVKPMTALIFLGILLLIALFCSLLYTLEYWMIDRKLNLN